MLHLLSAFVLCLVIGGVMTRKTPAFHLRFMVSAFLLDLALVIYIEVTRHAVEKVATQTGLLLWFHAAVSLLVLAAYVGQIGLARRMLAGFVASRRIHITLGITFCALRLLNYITSFMI
jgi:hypothetical protein